jgi:hypothetical protein
MNNWERLVYKILGLRPIKKDPFLLNKPSWLLNSPSDIIGGKYLVIR